MTSVPTIYSFPKTHLVSEALADHIVAVQNAALNNMHTHRSSLSLSNLNLNMPVGKLLKRRSLKAQRQQKRRFKIALSGGSLIPVIRDGLLSRKDVNWSKWDIYFADERLVSFNSKDSIYGITKRLVFDKIPESQQPRIFHIDESSISNPAKAANDYEKELIKGFAAKDSVKLPRFDLILLGCAPDGHTLSHHPNSPSLRETNAWILPITVPSSSHPAGAAAPNRISFSIPVVTNANRVTFVVEGNVKAKIVKDIMERPDKGLPCSVINEAVCNNGGYVTWFVDDAALHDVSVLRKEYVFQVPKVKQ